MKKPGFRIFLYHLPEDSNKLHSPRYIGHQCATVNPLSSLSSLIGTLLNNGSAVYEMGPANVAMERVIAEFFATELGFSSKAEGLFTSGGSLGNLTALLAARQNKTPYDIWEEGLRPDDQPAIMVAGSSHYSVDRVVRIMGLGAKSVIPVEVDDRFLIKTPSVYAAFKKSRQKGMRVIALVANACSTATGSYDNLRETGEFCRQNENIELALSPDANIV